MKRWWESLKCFR